MERIDDGTYRCTICGTKVHVAFNDTPVDVLFGASGKPNERVVTVGNVEVHRCTVAADWRTPGAAIECRCPAKRPFACTPRPGLRSVRTRLS